MIDVGGGSVKLRVTGRRGNRAFDSGESLSARDMALRVRSLTQDWTYDRVSIAYPGKVRNGQPEADPRRVGTGWVGFDYTEALGSPVRLINDAAMQALAAYRGGTMLFVGLGTGLGSALIAEDVLVPLELGVLRVEPRRSLLDLLAADGLSRLGVRRWRSKLFRSVHDLASVFCVDEIVLGGGNATRIGRLPRNWRRQHNSHCLRGAERLWGEGGMIAEPVGSTWHIHRTAARAG